MHSNYGICNFSLVATLVYCFDALLNVENLSLRQLLLQKHYFANICLKRIPRDSDERKVQLLLRIGAVQQSKSRAMWKI